MFQLLYISFALLTSAVLEIAGSGWTIHLCYIYVSLNRYWLSGASLWIWFCYTLVRSCNDHSKFCRLRILHSFDSPTKSFFHLCSKYQQYT